MSKRRAWGCALLVALAATAAVPVTSQAAEAPPINVVKDLSVGPVHPDGSDPSFFTLSGSKMVFRANNGVSGIEPWVTDGTPGGTVLLKDVETGSEHSYPYRFTTVGSTTYFFTYSDATELSALWKTDGTPGGTSLVKADLYDAEAMQPVGSTLYFFEGDVQTKLWKTDGTPGGTLLVETFANNLSTVRTAALGTELVFSAWTPSYGYELWKSDGTDAALLKDIVTGEGDSDPNIFGVVGGQLFFRAFEPTATHTTLWKTDGTADNTVVVEDPMTSGPRAVDNETYAVAGGKLYFMADDGTNGRDLWVSDGTSGSGTGLIEDITPGTDFSNIYGYVVAVGSTVYFLYNNLGNAELWSSDGTPENTSMIEEVSPAGSGGANDLVAGDDEVFWVGDDGTTGMEVWRSNGTASNAAVVANLGSGSTSSNPTSLAFGLGDQLFFAANAGFGQEPYVTTGDPPSGATLLKDVHPPSSEFNDARWGKAGSNIYFAFDDGVHGTELWKSNGTSAGTVMVEDIYPDGDGSFPQSFVAMNGIIYFNAYTPTHGNELWRSDGTELGTYRLEDISPGGDGGYVYYPTVVGNKLFFGSYSPATGIELYVTDGSVSGAQLVKDITPTNTSNVDNLTAVGSELWFTVPTGDVGETGTYRTDGTETGTVKVSSNLAYPSIALYNGSVYFNAYGETNGELYKSDGTPEGTVQISHQSGVDGGFNAQDFTILNNVLYFLANEDGSSQKPRLYKTTGTEASTSPLSPLSLEFVDDLQKVGNRLVFRANDGTHGVELWRSDGTFVGTKLIEDIGPGTSVTGDGPIMTVIGKALFFAARDATHGRELWISDGTAANTFMVQDFNDLGDTRPTHMIGLGNKILFAGNTETLGRELLGLTSPRATSLSLKVAKKPSKLKASGVLNPAHAGAPITVTLYKKKDGRFRKVATKKPSSSAAGAYATSFARPDGGRCKLTAKYAGHIDHKPATRSIQFRC